jgi:hypothetical protein
MQFEYHGFSSGSESGYASSDSDERPRANGNDNTHAYANEKMYILNKFHGIFQSNSTVDSLFDEAWQVYEQFNLEGQFG